MERTMAINMARPNQVNQKTLLVSIGSIPYSRLSLWSPVSKSPFACTKLVLNWLASETWANEGSKIKARKRRIAPLLITT
jgi:hypothetical protein